MIRPRIIPILLLHQGALTKTIQFKKHRYIGDPINAVHLFNQMKADELVFLDIEASKEGRPIDLSLIREIGEEADMPFSVGGGITTLDQISACIKAGAERVILGEVMYTNPNFVKKAVEKFGSSTISVCIDYGTNWFKQTKCYYRNANKSANIHPTQQAIQMQDLGVGEIILQSIDRDGMMSGYDTELIEDLSKTLHIPLVAVGGAGSYHDVQDLQNCTKVRGIAAGSLFIYQGKQKGVLINYPKKNKIKGI